MPRPCDISGSNNWLLRECPCFQKVQAEVLGHKGVRCLQLTLGWFRERCVWRGEEPPAVRQGRGPRAIPAAALWGWDPATQKPAPQPRRDLQTLELPAVTGDPVGQVAALSHFRGSRLTQAPPSCRLPCPGPKQTDAGFPQASPPGTSDRWGAVLAGDPSGSAWKLGNLPQGSPRCLSLGLSLPAGLLQGAQALPSLGNRVVIRMPQAFPLLRGCSVLARMLGPAPEQARAGGWGHHRVGPWALNAAVQKLLGISGHY